VRAKKRSALIKPSVLLEVAMARRPPPVLLRRPQTYSLAPSRITGVAPGARLRVRCLLLIASQVRITPVTGNVNWKMAP
jgi:hypothetical protein